ncbi:MAG: hypothetical protein ACF787_10140 [Rhodopirellula sp. JB053]|uniref:hypothetical protein n=1 Tax=Rhodopirellula sp. JB044 TaxID=3342844 RepID=UPI00370BFCB7
MSRFSIAFVAAVCVTSASIVGCGDGGPTAPTGDEIQNFVDENPDIVAETERFEADPFDESTE